MLSLVLLIAALISGLAAAAISWRVGRRPRRPAATARGGGGDRAGAGGAAGSRGASTPSGDRARAQLALVLIVGGGLVLAVLAHLVRGDTHLVRIDPSVAEWGDRLATPFSTRRPRRA